MFKILYNDSVVSIVRLVIVEVLNCCFKFFKKFLIRDKFDLRDWSKVDVKSNWVVLVGGNKEF